jgi:hypothetical protein
MRNSRIKNRRRAGRLVVALAALCSAGSCAAVEAPDHCIVGDNAIGCRSEQTIAQVTSFRGDADALRDAIGANLSSGSCRLFEYGERVQVTGHQGSELNAVRLPRDAESYWMPASWSRPAAECAANASARTIEKKLGMPEHASAAPPTEQPQAIAREGTTRSDAPGCVIKPVMTDAEIAACRSANR